MKYGPPTDAALRRERLSQLHNQRYLEERMRDQILYGTAPLAGWQREWLQQVLLETPHGLSRRAVIERRLAESA